MFSHLVFTRLKAYTGIFFGILTMTFFMIRLLPGDPVLFMLGDYATEASVSALRTRLGMDKPVLVQFFLYLRQVITGDLGTSLITRRPVLGEIYAVLLPTLELAATGIIIAVVIGLLVGVLSAVKRRTWADYIGMTGALAGVSMPLFWLGMLILLIFSHYLGWFPATGPPANASVLVRIRYATLPGLTLGLYMAGLLARVTRTSILELLRADFVRTARAKGLSEVQVLWHILRATLGPIVTVIGLYLGIQLGGTVLVETVFARPGIGSLLVTAIFNRDYPLVQGVVLIFAALLLTVNLAVDILIRLLDPTIER